MPRPGFDFLLGIAMGLLSGLFGVGGSSIATPLLRLAGVPQLTALATPLPVTLPTALIGAAAYWRRGLVRRRVFWLTAASGIPAVIAGAALSDRVPGRALMFLAGLAVALTGVRLLRGAVKAGGGGSRDALLSIFTGLGIGFLSGLLANGGGFLLVPAYLILFRMTPAEAAATSLAVVGVLAVPGSWVHWRLGHVDPGLALRLTAGVLPSTYLGAWLGLRLPPERSRRLFGWFMLLFGLLFVARTLWRAARFGWAG